MAWGQGPKSKVGEAAGFGKGRGCDSGVPMAATLLRPRTGALRKRPVQAGQGKSRQVKPARRKGDGGLWPLLGRQYIGCFTGLLLRAAGRALGFGRWRSV